jgi:tetratricopeptide (TPR) repeat protein
VNEQSEHLSNAQIENYGNRTSGAGSDANQPDEALRINAHLESCPSCRSHLLDFHRASFGLLAAPQQLADVQVNTASTPECPSDDALRQLAAGLTPDALATKLTQHASTCDHCGPLLRAFTEDFSDDFSPEEQVVLNNLRSSSVAWQKNTAREMLKRAIPSLPSPRPIFSWKWIMTPAAACALLALGIGGVTWYARRDTPEKAEKYLAQAYTEQRTIEVRWPGADWGQYSVQRGTMVEAKSTSLMRAEIAVEHQTEKTLKEIGWIRVAAETQIIAGHPQNAIPALEKALRSYPGSVPLLLDLAIAYFGQGEQTHSRESYEKSRDLLGNVLQREPTNTVALFNRALVYGRLNVKDKAADDWNTFLKTEKDVHWLAEAQKKLTDLRDLN